MATASVCRVIEFRAVTKRFPDGTLAVTDLDLIIPPHQVTVFVGSSGSGKTTILRMINRMVDPTSGSVLIDDVDIATREPVALRRSIGYVMQNSGLLPHRTVIDNIATVPRLLGWDKQRTRARVDELLELVALDAGEYRDRYPSQLSGGQRQRVGVARALACDPPLMLMDEPFGAIDPINRGNLQNQFLRLQEQIRKTVVFVTHDIYEALKMGDRVAVMKEGGVLAQDATPQELLESPVDDYVADFVGVHKGINGLALEHASVTEFLHKIRENA